MKPTRAVYSNNRTAPRMKKGKFSKMVVTKELYKRFLEEYPEYKELSWGEFYKGWLDLAEIIRTEAITNPLGVKLGSYTGELKLQFLPYKFEAADMHVSAEEGEKVKFLNLDEKGKVAKIKWERRWAVKFNRILQFYGFDETREMNKLAKDYIDKHPEKLRVSRVTLGGKNVWRDKMGK